MTRRAAFVAIGVGAIAVFGVACAYTRYVPLNPDIAWQVYIAVALARGAQLGRDLIEVNPPLAAWLDVPVVQLSAPLGLSPAFGHQLATMLLGLWSVALVTLVGRAVAALQRSTALVAFSLACAIPLALHGGLEVGQREQMAILLALPYFILLAARLEGAQVSTRLALVVGISAGLGFALKPFFVLPLALGELLLLVEHRRLRALFRTEVAGMATVFAAYPVAIVLAAPEWLASAREFWPLYGGYRVATARDIVARHGRILGLALLALLAWAVARRHVGRASRLGDALAVGLVGFALAMLLQRKPWTYLTLPSAVLAVALLMATVLETSGRMRTTADRLLRAMLVLLVSLRLAWYAVWLAFIAGTSLIYRTSLAEYEWLRSELDSLPPGTTFGSIAPTHGAAFPLVLDVQGRWVMRLPSLWPAMSASAQDATTQDRLRRLVAADLAQGRPEILLVASTDSPWLGPPAQRDWMRWLAELPEGAAALAPYREWRRLGTFVVLRRDSEIR
jgi:hypothetical protein